MTRLERLHFKQSSGDHNEGKQYGSDILNKNKRKRLHVSGGASRYIQDRTWGKAVAISLLRIVKDIEDVACRRRRSAARLEKFQFDGELSGMLGSEKCLFLMRAYSKYV